MNVSRETLESHLDLLKNNVGEASFSVKLKDQEDLLPFFLSTNPGSFLLVENDLFWSVFNVLHKSELKHFSVLTDLTIDSPLGFVSPLKRAVDNFVVHEKELDRIVLVNRSCFEGFYPFYFKGNVVIIKSKTLYDELLLSLEEASLIRVSSVVSPGTYTKRGAVIDFFPLESDQPIRVDFSYDTTKIFIFDIVSQLTIKEVDSFSFIGSKPSYQKVETKKLLKGLLFSSYLNGNLVCGEKNLKININTCSYDSYRSFSGKPLVSNFLHSVGVFINKTLFIPSWFLGNLATPSPSEAASSLLDGFEGLKLGDPLIHEGYGVCLFDGLVDGLEQNEGSIILVFKDGKILLPVSKIFLLSVYSGVGSYEKLSSLSKRGLWTRKKESISKKINDFVQQLLDQHLSRITSAVNRNALDMDTLKSFIGAFKYKDTADQSLSFKDVLADMTSSTPMDRLLCGDVGFGKTEIAIRAAFLSILMGGRVVVLAPTTILCYQLLDSFRARLSPFAVNVQMVSRLNAASRVSSNIAGFNGGKIDVLVSTHRVFSHIQEIKNISLLIVDEEHRFGVKQKESFVKKFPLIDILSMSATPIPRSLQSAFSGIKTMSTISTPPINRLPIQTTIDYFNENMIANYVNHEVSRSGQVYFLHNNVQSLERIRRILSKVCPNVSVDIVHGKMTPKKIESVISNFSKGGFQVLISTTIIENGLDISNVNTIVINNAHLFGLSQLHQIRGRVGRHNRQAFAYLLIPKSLNLNRDGKKRLKAIEENVSLGSGYNLSSKDLEIRGGGSLFGYSQSGGSQIGFELYNKILNLSLSNLRGKNNTSIDSVVVKLAVEKSFIPSSYVNEDGLSVSLYKTLLSCSSLKDLTLFKKTLLNRFGQYPEEVSFLFWSQELRILSLRSNVSSIVVNQGGGEIIFLPGEHLKTPISFIGWVSDFFKELDFGFSFKQGSGNRIFLCFTSSLNKKDIYMFLKDLLNKFNEDFLETK